MTSAVVDKRISLIFNYQHPGKYAFNVLAGAVEASEIAHCVDLYFPRSREELLRVALDRGDRGETVVAAWSFYTPSFPKAANELRWFCTHAKARPILCLAGGVHATAETEQTLRAGFDLVAVGEGEHILLELLRRMLRGDDPKRTQGIWHMQDGRIAGQGSGDLVDLDRHPPFAPRHGKFGAIEITRGCIYACKFCQTPFMNRARFRHRSVENICHWVAVMRQAGLEDVRFITPTSMSYGASDEKMNLDAVEHLLASVRRTLRAGGRLYYGTFPSEVRPEHVTSQSLAVLKRYVDNDNLIIGGQSGSDSVLKMSHRGHDVEAITRAVRLAREAGFTPNVDFIFGLPGEQLEDARATLILMRSLAELGARVHGHTFMPLPGTPFRHSPPGRIDPLVQRELDWLSSHGRLYGQWRQQMVIAQTIADGRTPPRPRA
jgi:B12-binding domain/radical SAM domain protein